jgi:iron complex outermembrane recepter protein
MQIRYYVAVSTAAMTIASFSQAAFAQSTGSIEVEEDAIVVTGTRTSKGVDGFVAPDATKARAVLTQEIIERQAAGQSILNTINLIPGVNFTNSDAYGSSGGNIRIRGFDGNRISLTFDGFPLNDSGNYAIFSNQQLDPELIEQVNVNLGTTDVDSPTASAAGGTVNYRTITGGSDLGAELSASFGEENYRRVFGRLNFGEFTSFRTKGWVSASTARNDKFKGPGEIYKQQFNGRIYQPIGDNGDFVSIAGHYNQNRNNFYRNPAVNDLRTLFTSTVIPGATTVSSANPIDLGVLTSTQKDSLFNFENDEACVRPVPGPGRQIEASSSTSTTATCTNFFGVRINPSNTGNVRFNSKFTLTDNLIFTADASWQYVLANGGGISVLDENSAIARGSSSLPGVDYNGDGDVVDRVAFYTPNNTNTRRYTAIMSLIWDIAPEHRVRLAYTHDRANHVQTGDWGYLNSLGQPENVFGGRNGRPVLAADGFQLQQRDRRSVASLNQVAAQYIGKFFDERLRVEIGVRAPFFKRSLNNLCYTQTGNGFATCTSQPVGTTPVPGTPVSANGPIYIVPANFAGPFPTPNNNAVFAPFRAEYKFDKFLPNVGLKYKITDDLSLFASYAKGFSAPRTDNLYRAPSVTVTPETTDAFDLGLSFSSSKIQAQLTGWYIGYQNRIVTSFDQAQGISVDRNVGKVKSYGFDGNIAFKPVDALSLYLFGSYNHSKLQEDIVIGRTTGPTGPNAPAPAFILAPTKGKFVTETPKWTVGGRAQVSFGPLSIGGQVKYVGSRFATDVNDVKVPSYTLVDLDARFSLKEFGLDKTYIQLNASNLFNQFYFGNISTQINHGNICVTGYTCLPNGANPNFSLGSPRTFMGTLHVGF